MLSGATQARRSRDMFRKEDSLELGEATDRPPEQRQRVSGSIPTSSTP